MRYTIKLILCALNGLVLQSCSKQTEGTPTKEIVGAYAVENSFDVPDISSGKILGIGKIRDTIYIMSKQNGFEVTNNKWQLNDFDMEGWRNLNMSLNKPMAPYQATYDASDSTLNSDPANPMPSLFLDLKQKRLYKGKDRTRAYAKVN